MSTQNSTEAEKTSLNSASSNNLEIKSQDLSHIDLTLSYDEKNAKVEEIAIKYGVNHKKLMWKIDICVVPPFCLLYFLAFLDRVNMSNAKVYGMEKALGLEGNQFATALTVFFIPYIIFEVLSNHMLKFVKPHTWLSILILLFGVVTICVAYSKNFAGLVVCRLFLGIFEAGSFPAIFYILANFYSAGESLKRFSFFFNCTCLAGGCAGALAFRIHDLDGVHGLESWQWIFIIEGAMTAGLSIPLYFSIADFPEEARFLKQNERDFLKKKLEVYAGNSGFEIKQTWSDIGKVFKEPMMYICAVAYFCLVVPSYSYAFFAPTIIKELGYTAMNAQSHSIYPWLATMGFSGLLAVFSDYFKHRTIFALFASATSIAGLSIVFAATNSNARYAGCFLANMGLYSCMPILICWMSLNFSGHTRKSVGTAFVVGFGNIGGIVASYIFPNSDAPRYRHGISICIGLSSAAFVVILSYTCYLMWFSKKKSTDTYKAKWNALDERDQIMSGDLNPDSKYFY
ncbi:Tna1 protein [Martiniozyma asiatica (nom. inval.)]|nr:Tna1 protein [Martiniozyma asiatica]